MRQQDADYGVYLHVPFCRQRCDYCAFVTYTDRDWQIGHYVEAVLAELGEQRQAATSVFFGGGTPSMLSPEAVTLLVEAIDLSKGAEVTLELNPEDASIEYLTGLRTAGITRLSVGIQSTAPHVLVELGRIHRADSARTLAQMIDAVGFETWSMDLIVGTVGESDGDLLDTIETVLDHEAAPPHLSAYLLTPERATPLGRDVYRHPSEEVLADRYLLLDRELSARGYEWYEISNFSKPGHHCRHNELYWSQGNYLGVGPAAHSHFEGRRSWRIANLDTWLSQSARGESTEAGYEIVEDESARFEAACLSLRTRRGVPASLFENLDDLSDFVERDGDQVVLTPRGRLVADEIARRLVLEAETQRG